VRGAERRLASATAQVGIATADLFPKFSLTGAFGLDSSRPADLPKWSSHYYSIVPGVRWPVLDWGRAREAIHLQNERQAQALTNYESMVMQALKDVEDALVRYRTERARRDALVRAVDAGRRAFTIAQQRFEHGLADSLVVLEAQRAFLRSEDALAQSDAAIRADLIALYKALGGGWET
jgi:outer membrane protein TolC